MKKLIFSLVVIGAIFITSQVQAAGTFTLLEPTSLPDAIVNISYQIHINFIYSGTYLPGVSLIGTQLPQGLKLGSVEYGANGLDNILLSGVPTQLGRFPLTLLLTDNNGTVLTKTFDLNVVSKDLYSVSTESFSDMVVGTPYVQDVKFHYYGTQPVPSFDNLPKDGGCYYTNTLTDEENAVVASGTGTTRLYCSVPKEGQFDITFYLASALNQFSKNYRVYARYSQSQNSAAQANYNVPVVSPVPNSDGVNKIYPKTENKKNTNVEKAVEKPNHVVVSEPTNLNTPSVNKQTPVQKKSFWNKITGWLHFKSLIFH